MGGGGEGFDLLLADAISTLTPSLPLGDDDDDDGVGWGLAWVVLRREDTLQTSTSEDEGDDEDDDEVDGVVATDTCLPDDNDDGNGTALTTTTSVTDGLPVVNVPVLSNTTHVTLCAISNACPPLINNPCCAPTVVPTITAVGVASPSAQGQLMTMTLMANKVANNHGSPYSSSNHDDGTTCVRESVSHVMKVSTATVNTNGVNFPAR